jgi:hypothetical protein
MRTGSEERSTLTEFFRLNAENAVGYGTPARSLLYQDFPRWFTWTNKKTFEGRQQRSDMIGRIYFASITEGEQYFLRLLLLHWRGATSFADLRTVAGVEFDTFQEASNDLGLLVSDRHYVQCMTDAAHWKTGHSLQLLFCMLLIHSPPADPLQLFEKFVESLSNDCNYRLERFYRIGSPTVEERVSLCCFLLQEKLSEHGKSFANVGLDPLAEINYL